jgi:hypothetical protein
MPIIVAAGREYPWPSPETITFREAKLIKTKLGVSVMETLLNLSEGKVDEDTLLAMFLVAKVRADGDVDVESVLDLQFTDLAFKDEPDEKDEPVEDGTPRPLDDAKPEKPGGKQKKKPASSGS